MPETGSLLLFATAAALLLATPGPAIFYIVARSVAGGRRAGIASVLGISFGTLFHVAAAAVGLSALLAKSALAFAVVKYAGAGYLIYLGSRQLIAARDGDARKGEVASDDPLGPKVELRGMIGTFFQGALVNLLNPKTALFFLAFLPQFVDPGAGAAAAQMVVLGLVYIALAVLIDGGYALLAGRFGEWLASRGAQAGAQRFTGGVYLALGLGTALVGSGRD